MNSLKKKIEEAANNAGAKSKIDVGVFLIGASAGGLVDAKLNFFGFVEPMVIAPLTGAALLGVKQTFLDPLFAGKKKQIEHVESEGTTYQDLEIWIEALEAAGNHREASSFGEFVKTCEEKNISAEKCEEIYNKAKLNTPKDCDD